MKTLTKPSVSTGFLPYGRQNIGEEDIAAVVEVLKSDYLTQGPAIEKFEKALADKVGAEHAVACANGTAALHLAMLALGLGPGDVVVTTPNTFLASANCARYVGAEVRFADIDPETGLMDVESLRKILDKDTTRQITAVIPVHFAGQAVDMSEISALARQHGAYVVDDACHAVGGTYDCDGETRRLGDGYHSDLTVFSFHPVKHIAMGEGGAITTSDAGLAERLRLLRCHGMQKDNLELDDMAHSPSGDVNPWYYEMHQLGFNYRVTDIQAALGYSQIQKLDSSVRRRQEIADLYRKLIAEQFDLDDVRPLAVRTGVSHAYHLFVLLIDFDKLGLSRADAMNELRSRGIGTQVHYIPIHLQPYYRKHSGTSEGDYPGAESYYGKALSIPMYPDLTDSDCERVIAELKSVLRREN